MHTFQPLKREPAYLKVYHAVEADIRSGVLAEGEALPTEAELCEQFACTRSTVREGLRLLEQSGIVARGAAKRFYVRKPSAEHVASTASRSLALGGATFNEVWEALSTFYPQAARLAAEKMTPDDLDKMQSAHARFVSIDPKNGYAIVEEAAAFFHALAGSLQNNVMLAVLQSLNMLIESSLRHVIDKTPRAKQRIVKAQAQIIQAIESGEPGEAEVWMLKHINDLRRGYVVAKVDMNSQIVRL